MSTWKVSGAFCLEADLEVFITEVKLGARLSESGVCKICGGTSSFVPGPQRCGDAQDEAGRGQQNEKDKVEEPLLIAPPRPPSSTKPQPAGFTSEGTAELARVQMRHKTALAVPQEGDRKGNQHGIDTVSYTHLRAHET